MRQRKSGQRVQCKADMGGSHVRGTRFIDRKPFSVITLKHGIRKKNKPEEFRVLPRDATAINATSGDVSQSILANGDIRPNDCDIIGHGTEREKLGYASRIVLTLKTGLKGGCNNGRAKLYYTGKRYGFRVYPLRDDNGDETSVYTLATVSESALAFLRTALWVASLEETPIKLPGHGAIDHIARKPKRKRGSFHPDYVKPQGGRKPRFVGVTEPRIY